MLAARAGTVVGGSSKHLQQGGRVYLAGESLLSGMRIEEVSTILGHSSVKITERHYSLRPNFLDLGAGRIPAVFEAPLWVRNHRHGVRSLSANYCSEV